MNRCPVLYGVNQLYCTSMIHDMIYIKRGVSDPWDRRWLGKLDLTKRTSNDKGMHLYMIPEKGGVKYKIYKRMLSLNKSGFNLPFPPSKFINLSIVYTK